MFERIKPAIIVAVLALSFVLQIRQVVPEDLHWYLQAGKIASERFQDMNEIPNTFSYVQPDRVWVKAGWLSSYLYYKLYSAYGIRALVFLKALLFLLMFVTFFLLLQLLNPKNWLLHCLLVLIFAFQMTKSSLVIRARNFTMLFFCFELLLIYLYAYRSKRWIYLLPLLSVLWVNLHLGFLIGVVLFFMFCLAHSTGIWVALGKEEHPPVGMGAKLRRMIQERAFIETWAVLGLMILASLINPAGPGAWWHIAEWFVSGTHHGIIENMRPNVYIYWGSMGVLFVVSFVLFWVNISGRNLFEILLLAAAVYFSLSMNRNVPFALVLFSMLLTLSMFGFHGVVSKILVAVSPLLLFIYFVLYFFKGVFLDPLLGFQLHASSPVAAIKHLNSQKLKGNVFHEYLWGGLMISMSRMGVFIDGRLKLAYDDHVFDEYMNVAGARKNWLDVIEKYRIRYFLLRDRPSDLSTRLERYPWWRKIYSDGIARIYAREDVIIQEPLDEKKRKTLQVSLKCAIQKADRKAVEGLVNAYSGTDRNTKMLKKIVQAASAENQAGFLNALSKAFMEKKLYYEAHEILGILWKRSGNVSDFVRARLFSELGRYGDAEEALKRYGPVPESASVGHRASVHYVRGKIYSGFLKMKEARAEFVKALALKPGDRHLIKLIAAAHIAQEESYSAAKWIDRIWKKYPDMSGLSWMKSGVDEAVSFKW